MSIHIIEFFNKISTLKIIFPIHSICLPDLLMAYHYHINHILKVPIYLCFQCRIKITTLLLLQDTSMPN